MPPGRHGAHELRGGRDRMARSEHHAERRQHEVEARVLERQSLGVALDPARRSPRPRRAAAGDVEQLRA